jgi:hypothetical protein
MEKFLLEIFNLSPDKIVVMEKDFDTWNEKKKLIHREESSLFFYGTGDLVMQDGA